MANQEHLDILKQGVDIWNQWRKEHPDITDPDLSGANLIDADLSGANLSHANLNFANLSLANLNHAKLSNTNLDGADIDQEQLDEVFTYLHATLPEGLMSKRPYPRHFRRITSPLS